MKSVMRGVVLAMASVFAVAAAAHAETLDVKVPFAFMVGSQKMPAGEYRVERDSSMPSSVILIQGQHGNRAQLFVQTTPLIGANPAGDAPAANRAGAAQAGAAGALGPRRRRGDGAAAVNVLDAASAGSTAVGGGEVVPLAAPGSPPGARCPPPWGVRP